MADTPEKWLCFFEALTGSGWQEADGSNGTQVMTATQIMQVGRESERPATMTGTVSVLDPSFVFGMSGATSTMIGLFRNSR